MIYGIVDAARDPTLYDLIHTCPERACLFAGDIAPPLNRVAPYLVHLNSEASLAQAWHREGWGQNWGILCQSPNSLADVRRQLRRFLLAMLPDGQIGFFRFYDPRVFRVYFPALGPEDRKPWFEVVDEYRVEAELGNGTWYCRPDGVETVMRFA